MSKESKEETLDPEDWDEIRALGHRMLEDMITRLETIRDHQFIWPSQEDVNSVLTPLTLEGEGEEKVYKVFKKHIMNQSIGQIKPNFWGASAGTGSVYGMLAEMLTGGVNKAVEYTPYIAGYTHK